MLADVLDAQSNLDMLLDRMLAGEEIVIARQGLPMARLVPVAVHTSLGKIRLGGLKHVNLGLSADFHAPATDDDLFGEGQ